MPEQSAKYERIRIAPYFQELILPDVSPTALEAMRHDVGLIYQQSGKNAPYLRTLINLSSMFALTLYAARALREMAGEREYESNNLRGAVPVQNNAFVMLVKELTRVFSSKTSKITTRLFTDRQAAIRWLEEDIPATHESSLTSSDTNGGR
ncbi:MAG: hypothetical protein OHK0023_12830 [Anaerolineae bacterium]